jgi:hypothetical protein
MGKYLKGSDRSVIEILSWYLSGGTEKFFPLDLQSNSGLGRLHETFRSTSVTRSRTVGRTPWTGDQLVARPLPVHKHRTTQTLNIYALSGIRTHCPGIRASEDNSCIRPLGYRDWLASERAKTVHASDRSATVTGLRKISCNNFWIHASFITSKHNMIILNQVPRLFINFRLIYGFHLKYKNLPKVSAVP